jgi:hypothetical protein
MEFRSYQSKMDELQLYGKLLQSKLAATCSSPQHSQSGDMNFADDCIMLILDGNLEGSLMHKDEIISKIQVSIQDLIEMKLGRQPSHNMLFITSGKYGDYARPGNSVLQCHCSNISLAIYCFIWIRGMYASCVCVYKSTTNDLPCSFTQCPSRWWMWYFKL